MGKKRKFEGKQRKGGKKARKQWDIDLTKSKKMIAGTCVSGQEGPCQQELVLALTEIANEHYPIEAESKNQDADISKGLDAELASHGEKGKSKRFQFIRAPRGQVHIHFIDESLCPFDIVTKYFEAIDNGKEVGKYVIRMMPLNTCFASTDQIQKLAKRRIDAYPFKEEQKTFGIVLRRKNNNKVKRDEVIKIVADLMPKRFTVNLSEPDVVIILNVNQRLAGCSIGDGKIYHQFSQFNLQKHLEKGEPKDAPTKNDEIEKTKEPPSSET